MASSSKYIQLSQNVLMEYIYSDQSEINTPGNPWRKDTDDFPIWIMENAYTNQDQILNDDSVISQTGNGRNRSFAIIGSHRGALLDINRPVFYNDFDENLTPTDKLPLIISNKSPVYDTVRFHMVQGFDFEGKQGMVSSIKFKDKKDNDIILSNFVYLKGDSWETYNPNPFFFAGRIYNSYVEVKILSLYNLIEDYRLRRETDGFLVERLTGGVGIKLDQFVQIYFSFVNDKTTINGQEYIDLIDVKSVDLPIRDQFEKISAYIKESEVFDYVEYYATFGGEVIQNYILDLNNSGGDYIILHDLVVSEYVYDSSTGNHSWITTDTLQNIQDSDFGRVNNYRPIIKNSGSISYKINYTVRLYNKADGSQIWKTSSMISNSVAKYGRKLKSIAINENVTKAKIYNQSIVKEITVNKLPEKFISNTKYITSLFNINNVSVSSSTELFLDSSTNTSGIINGNYKTLPTKIYQNGLGILHIPNSTVYLQFNIYDLNSSGYSLVNLTGYEEFVLSFTDNTNQDYDIVEYINQSIEKSKGQLMFKITKEQASKILSLTNRTFTIYQKNKKIDPSENQNIFVEDEKTFLYSGKFYSTEEINKIKEIEKISSLESEIENLKNNLNLANLQILNNQKTITDLNTELTNVSKSNTDLAIRLANVDAASALDLLIKENSLLQQRNQMQNTTALQKIALEQQQKILNEKNYSSGVINSNWNDIISKSNINTTSIEEEKLNYLKSNINRDNLFNNMI